MQQKSTPATLSRRAPPPVGPSQREPTPTMRLGGECGVSVCVFGRQGGGGYIYRVVLLLLCGRSSQDSTPRYVSTIEELNKIKLSRFRLEK